MYESADVSALVTPLSVAVILDRTRARRTGYRTKRLEDVQPTTVAVAPPNFTVMVGSKTRACQCDELSADGGSYGRAYCGNGRNHIGER